MLGIRRYLGAAIDLFTTVGDDRSLFICDMEVSGASPAILQDGLKAAEARGFRHVGIFSAVDAQASFAALKSFLGQRGAARAVQRVTIVLPDTVRYYEFQDVLFASFPEEGSATS